MGAGPLDVDPLAAGSLTWAIGSGIPMRAAELAVCFVAAAGRVFAGTFNGFGIILDCSLDAELECCPRADGGFGPLAEVGVLVGDLIGGETFAAELAVCLVTAGGSLIGGGNFFWSFKDAVVECDARTATGSFELDAVELGPFSLPGVDFFNPSLEAGTGMGSFEVGAADFCPSSLLCARICCP